MFTGGKRTSHGALAARRVLASGEREAPWGKWEGELNGRASTGPEGRRWTGAEKSGRSAERWACCRKRHRRVSPPVQQASNDTVRKKTFTRAIPRKFFCRPAAARPLLCAFRPPSPPAHRVHLPARPCGARLSVIPCRAGRGGGLAPCRRLSRRGSPQDEGNCFWNGHEYTSACVNAWPVSAVAALFNIAAIGADSVL